LPDGLNVAMKSANFRVNRQDLGEFPFRTELDKGLGKHVSLDMRFSPQKVEDASRSLDGLLSANCVFAEAAHPILQLFVNGTIRPYVRE
jgi:hypothetical protein